MIGIRADANSIIATGHVMRCLTIAKALVELGREVVFFIADEESRILLDSMAGSTEVHIVVLGTDWRNMEGELEILVSHISEMKVETLLVDSYSVTYDYFDKLRQFCKVAYLDDLYRTEYPVNLLINYSGYSMSMGYEEGYRNIKGYNDEPTRLLLGLEYAPLREQYYKNIKDSKLDEFFDDNSRKHILVSTGGADTCGMLMPILKKTADFKLQEAIRWHVVVGDFVSNIEEIKKFAENYSNIVIHRSVKNMADLMSRCDLAVIAGGTMLTECAAINLPAVFYQVADNQETNVKYWGNEKGMIFAGNANENENSAEKVVDTIFDEIGKIVSDANRISAMKAVLRGITDGRGAVRIAGALIGEV